MAWAKGVRVGAEMLRLALAGQVAVGWRDGVVIFTETGPTTEEMARAMSLRYQPEPVARWELPSPTDARESYETMDGENGRDIDDADEDDEDDEEG